MALALIAMVIALIAAGLVSYNSYKLGKMSKTQSEINGKLNNMSRSLSQLQLSINKLVTISSQINALDKSLSELKTLVEVLKVNQTSQASNLSKMLRSIAGLENQIETLRSELSSSSSNVTALQSEIVELEKRIDKLYDMVLFPVTVTDATGKPVTIPKKPTRIVSLLPSVTEILWTVNASSQVIAVDEYSNYPPQVVEEVKNGTLVNIGSGWYPNVELILSLRPDLVIGVNSVVSHHTLKKILAEYGIPVILLPDKTFQDVLDSIILVGRVTGHPVEAAMVAEKLREEAVVLRTYINNYINSTGIHRQKMAIIAWLKPLWVVGNSTFQSDMIKLAGGENAYSFISGWQAVSPESLLKANPDVIVVTLGYSGVNMTRQKFVKYLEGLLGNAVFNITAIKTGRIYFIVGGYNDIIDRPGPRVVLGARLLAAILYPGAFNLTLNEIPQIISPKTFKIPKLPTT